MLWTEKYRPISLENFYGQEGFKEDCLNWIQSNNMPNLLLYGMQGIGKTTAAFILVNSILKENAYNNVLELNASDDRKLETVRTKIKDFASSKKISKVPFKICILDEFGGMTNDAQNALKRIMEKYSSNVRFILICNDINKVIAPIKSRCANYLFHRIKPTEVVEAVLYILKKENINIPQNLDDFCLTFKGDLRRTIGELQANITSGIITSIPTSGFEEAIQLLIDSNAEEAREQLLKLSKKGYSVNDICNNLHDIISDGNLPSEIKFNYLRLVGETQYRGQTMTPRIALSWMVAQTL